MLVELVAVPWASTLRPGARFTVREDVPLVVGTSAHARLQVTGVGAGKDVVLSKSAGLDDSLAVSVDGVPLVCSLNGVSLERDARATLRANDHLFVAPGLVLRGGPAPADPRDSGLEGAVADAPTNPAPWAVYRDFLLEQGAAPPDLHGEFAQRKALATLADAHRSGALLAEWNEFGFLSRVHLQRSAVVGTPGLMWHLERLVALRPARFLTHLDVDYFVGTAPSHIDRPAGSVDETLAVVVELLRAAPFARSLRRLTLGHAASAPVLEQTALALGRWPWPHLDTELTTVVKDGVRARFDLLAVPSELAVVGLSVGESFVLMPRTDVGSGANCRLRVLGANVPRHAASIRRSSEGAWVISAEGVDGLSTQTSSPIKVNGVMVARSPLRDGDLVEPWPGVQFRFRAQSRR